MGLHVTCLKFLTLVFVCFFHRTLDINTTDVEEGRTSPMVRQMFVGARVDLFYNYESEHGGQISPTAPFKVIVHCNLT